MKPTFDDIIKKLETYKEYVEFLKSTEVPLSDETMISYMAEMELAHHHLVKGMIDDCVKYVEHIMRLQYN